MTASSRVALRLTTGSRPLDLLLLLLAALAVIVPVWVVRTAPLVRTAHVALKRQQRVVPPTVVPEVEPFAYQAIAPQDAQTFNQTVPFVTGPNPAARPFRFTGGSEDRERAINCLAAAVLFEAGDDRTGQQAVAQVVLNRVRHPAFPQSVCGVVFQGSERRTGCQFTFTCDGALARRYSQGFWERARIVAEQAIGGSVFAPVGLATHYHTDWVVPYWSSSLDKIAAVDTHLFFRWTGWWGTPPAFRRGPQAVEPRILQLAALFPAHQLPGVLAVQGEIANLMTGLGARSPIATAAGDTFVVDLDPRLDPSDFATLAERSCGERPYCKFLGWRDAADVPRLTADGLPADSPALATMSFSYLRDRARGFERALWNCADYPRPPVQCMKRAAPPAPAAAPPAAAPTPALPSARITISPKPAPSPLPGVRRRSEPKPAPTATPSPAAQTAAKAAPDTR